MSPASAETVAEGEKDHKRITYASFRNATTESTIIAI